jgi:hypothetical protein
LIVRDGEMADWLEDRLSTRNKHIAPNKKVDLAAAEKIHQQCTNSDFTLLSAFAAMAAFFMLMAVYLAGYLLMGRYFIFL